MRLDVAGMLAFHAKGGGEGALCSGGRLCGLLWTSTSRPEADGKKFPLKQTVTPPEG